MSKKPKIEFYEITLHHINGENITIREIFTSIYKANLIALNPEVDTDNLELTNNQLMADFFRHFFSRVDNGVVRNDSKRKAFKAHSAVEGEAINESIVYASEQNLIHGIIKGGEFDTGKDLSEIDNPDGEVERLGANKLITDDFYFLLYTPLNKDKAVLLLQSYTKDNVSDIFKPFIENLFKYRGLTLKATARPFMPKNMQDEFKGASVVKSFVYKNTFTVEGIENQTLQSNDFTINVEINAHGNNINLNNLPWWKNLLGQASLTVPNQDQRSLETFNTRRGYIQSNIGETNPTKFTLDAQNIDIKATIYLANFINLEENGIPIWDELQAFSIQTLNEDVKPEIYPEDYLQ